MFQRTDSDEVNERKLWCWWWMVLLFCSAAFGQATFSTRVDIWNHGGKILHEHLGANKGDNIRLEVRCNVIFRGFCFPRLPYLSDFRPMELVFSEDGHQVYNALSGYTGDQVVHAIYLGNGAEVEYEIHILASEPLK